MTKSKKMKEEIHNDRMISDDIIQVGNVYELVYSSTYHNPNDS